VSEQAHEAHGSLGEEASRLAEAVHEWLGEWRGRSGAAQDVWAAATQPSQDGAECRICPVCQALRLTRGARPEVFEHLCDAATSALAALRELLGEGPVHAVHAAHADPPGARRGGVEHIDLGGAT
jgi:hypothetical protein